MLRMIRLLVLFLRVSIQNEAAYRFDFFFRLVVSLLHLGGELFGLWTIFSNTRSIGGWTVFEVVVLLGVFRIMSGVIGMVIAPNMRNTMGSIRDGTLDFVLLRPVNAQFLSSLRTIVIWRGIDVALGGALVAVGCWNLSGGVSAASIARFVLTLAIGATIIYSIWLILATSAFWFTRLANVEMVFWNVFEAGRYPVDIYQPWLRWGLTFIIPLAFITTFPAATITGRAASSGLLTGLIAAPLALAGATLLWRTGLRRYSGASA